MKKLNKIRTIILGLLLLIAVVAKAQQQKLVAAFTFLEQNQLDSAKANINAAIAHPETANDAQTWQVRGYIYKAIYNKNEKDKKRTPARLEALY
jgi:Tfp pilus assembly protein PilF